MAIIGIDLGTTNSLVAVWKDGEAIIIPNVLGKNLTPSVISINDTDGILIGQVAKERLITHPDLTVANFKRYMGTKKTFSIGSYNFTPEELASFIIKSLKEDAKAYLGEDIHEAVISVPAYFNDSQRKATKRAGELAGLKVEKLISEPTAAAIAYGLHQENDNTQFLIFDLGGGTFDVSIIELFEGVMEVKSIAGDNFLGGEDFNGLLASHFIDTYNIKLNVLDKKTVSALFKQAEMCKRELSDKNIGKMNLLIDDKYLSLEISSDKFEKISMELISKLKIPIERAFRDADISSNDLDAVILIGGSTRMPIVKSIVSKIFRMLPFSNINPDETVALGAAIQAALKERNSDLKELVLTDVCPYTLGVEVSNKLNSLNYEHGIFSPIIERNSPIPISRVEPYYPISKNQSIITLKIYQGESRHVEENIKLGELEINIPPASSENQAFDVRFTYDINGLLEVEVTTVATGKKKNLVIENSPGSMTKEEVANRLFALKDIKIHPRDKTENKLILSRGERLYEESLGDKREFISDLLNKYEAVLATQDPIKIKQASKKLTQIFNEMEKSY